MCLQFKQKGPFSYFLFIFILIGISAVEPVEFTSSRSCHEMLEKQERWNQEDSFRRNSWYFFCTATGFWLAVKGENLWASMFFI